MLGLVEESLFETREQAFAQIANNVFNPTPLARFGKADSFFEAVGGGFATPQKTALCAIDRRTQQ